jgi:putative redox protein
MQIQIRQISPTTSETVIRGHRVAIDRPLEKGGSDQGPMGGELFLTSIGGCFMSTLLAAVRARNAEVSGMRTDVTATVADAPVRFTKVELCVTAECRDQAVLEHLVEIAERGCIMMNTLKDKIDLHVSIGARV